MPALTANTVTLAEVLEVRGGPLAEEELWPVMCQSTQSLQDVFLKGKARQRNFGTFTITPDTLLLCHTGHVKFSLHSASPGDRSFVAPEMYSSRALTSDARIEKICVYSLGMSLFHSAEFEVPVGQPINLSPTLENVLLAMCEESDHSRATLTRVLQECHNHYTERHYKDIVASLVESVLGDEIPDEIDLLPDSSQTDTSDYGTNGENYPSSMSSLMQSPRHLPSPPPPQISSKGHSTSAQLVGTNHRPALAPHVPDRRKVSAQHGREWSRSPGSDEEFYESPLLDKYKPQLQMSRTGRSPEPNGHHRHPVRTEDSRPGNNGSTRPGRKDHSYNRSQSLPRNGASSRNPPHYQEVDGYYEEPTMQLPPDLEARLRPNAASRRDDFRRLQRYGSENSVATTSSMASGPRSSMFSDGRSSSAISIPQGSYAPESFVTDGYDSDPYLVSFGSSVSQLGFRRGREKMPLREEPLYLSTPNLNGSHHLSNGFGHPPTDDNQYLSLPRLHKAGSRGTLGSKKKLKTFFGPEFVMISEDPNKSIINITPKKAGQLPHGRRLVSVVVLNGQKLQMMIETNTTTHQLYEQVIKYLGITDKIFFGLAQQKDGEHYFLDLDVKLSKYAPRKWKDEPKGTILEFLLYFRVKFYVENLALLDHLKTQHQFYLQLRRDLLEGRLYCHEEAAFLLAGLALQAETGDYSPALGDQYFLVEHYLSKRVVNKVTPDYAAQQLPEFHKGCSGLGEEDAELEFVKEAHKLPEYGLHFYKVQSGKKADADPLFLGICVKGLTVYEARGHIKSPVHKHSWQMTKKLSFKKKKFFLEPREGPDAVKLTFYAGHYKKAKYLLGLCTAFHRFQMKMRARLASIEQEAEDAGNVPRYHKNSPYVRTLQSRQASTESIGRIYNQPSRASDAPPLPRQFSSDFNQLERNRGSISDDTGTSPSGSLDVYKEKLPPQRIASQPSQSDSNHGMGYRNEGYLPEGSSQRDEYRGSQRELGFPSHGSTKSDHARGPSEKEPKYSTRGSTQPQETRIQASYAHESNTQPDRPGMHFTDETDSVHDNEAYVVDSTLNIPSLKKQATQDNRDANLPATPEVNHETTRDILTSPDREISVIKLRKEPGKGLGFTILGGENSKRLDLGIFVKSVTEGGAAARDHRLKAGDRILAVNGTSLETVSHEYAVMQLKTTATVVELVVLQSPHNSSTFDISSIQNVGSNSEEPQTLEVKPLITPVRQSQQQTSPQATVESPRSHFSSPTPSSTLSPRSPLSPGSPGDPSPATFSFQSEDEPVTMISKSISSLASSSAAPKQNNPPELRHFTNTPPGKGNQSQSRIIKEDVFRPVAMETSESAAPSSMQPLDVTQQTSRNPYGAAAARDGSQRDDVTAHSSFASEEDIHRDPDKTFVVELEKDGTSLGISVSGGINTTVKLGGIYVKSLMMNGPADLDGRIRIGDRILEVNGVSLVGVTHKQAVEVIKRAPKHCRLVIDRSVQVNVPSPTKRSSRKQVSDQVFTVELVKGIGGLGLSLVGGRDSEPEHKGLLRIKKMFPGQPAALSNKLQVGDIIMEVNGNSLDNASHQDAINIIRHESSTVQLLIKREPSTIPSSLLSRANSTASDVDPVQLLTDIQKKLRSDSPRSGSPSLDEEPELFNASYENTLLSAPERPTFLSSLREDTIEEMPTRRGSLNEKPLQHQLSDPVFRNVREHDPVTMSYSLPPTIPLRSDKESEEEKGVRREGSSGRREGSGSNRGAHPDVTHTYSGSSNDFYNKRTKGSAALSSDSLSSKEGSLPRELPPASTLVQAAGVWDSGNASSEDDEDGRSIEESDEEISIDIEDEEEVSVDAILPMDLPGLEQMPQGNMATRTPSSESRVSANGHTPASKANEVNSPLNILPQEKQDDFVSDDSDDEERREGLQMQRQVEERSPSSSEDSEGGNDERDRQEMTLPSPPQDSYLASPPRESSLASAPRDSYLASPPRDSYLASPPQDNSLASQLRDSYLASLPQDSSSALPPSRDSYLPPSPPLERSPPPPPQESSSSEDSDDDSLPDDTPQTKPLVDENLDSSLTPKEVKLTVELVKGSGGLGFTLAGGADTMGGCFVRDVIGDPAKSDGRLKKGDQILQVDDINISNMKHMTAVNVLRATQKHVRLVVLRRPTLVVSDDQSGGTYESINLTRTVRGRIGLILREGENGKILVDDVVPGEPAAQQGNLKHGDRIIEIGSHKVDGVGFLAARQFLDAARPVVQLVVERSSRDAESKYSMGGSLEQSLSIISDEVPHGSDDDDDIPDIEEPKDELFTVELTKGTRGFGFSLVAAPSSVPNVQGIFIKTISAGSVAEEDGRLRVGDQILKVSGDDVQGMSHARVIGMLRKITTTVELDIKRPAELLAVQSLVEKKAAEALPRSVPPLNKQDSALDLDITLEDAENGGKTTISSGDREDEEIADLISAISTGKTDPPSRPQLQKRDTDAVLSSLLGSINTQRSTNADLNSSWASSNNSDLDTTNKGNQLVDDDRPGYSTADSLPHNMSSGSEGKRISSSSYGGASDSIDSDYDDADVFDMLRDNSQMVIDMLKDSDDLDSGYVPSGGAKSPPATVLQDSMRGADVPPPIPTTPIPSDDDDDFPPPPPRKESLMATFDEDGMPGRKLVSNGFVKHHSSSSDGEAPGPLIRVRPGGRYSGQKLRILTGALQSKIDSNVPADEFKALREIKPTDGCDTAKRPANNAKNRYRNVLPFEATRVHLSGVGDEDYINANHIRVPVADSTYHYIATQGPLPNTTADFWQMVWEQGVEVVAMVTLEKEGGKVKCHHYWPDSTQQPLTLGTRFEVSLDSCTKYDSFVERKIAVCHLESGRSIAVTHLNFTIWPDHGIPKSPVDMVQFVKYLRNLTTSQAPIVIHCSAGIGRTGALITVDVALGLMERDQPFDVNQTIRDLREQRQGMIQTKDQYVFCYKACLEVLKSLQRT